MKNTSQIAGIDDKFLSRVYRAGIIAGVFISGALCFYKIQAAVSFAMGSAISLSFLWTLEYVVRRTLVPDSEKSIKKSLVLLALVKYIVIGVCFYLLLVRTKWLNAPALAAGLGLVYAVITVKALYIALFK